MDYDQADIFDQAMIKNTQPENMCDNGFEKVKSRGGTANGTSVYGEAAVRRVL